MTLTDKEMIEFAALAADIFLTKDNLCQYFPEWDWKEGYAPYHVESGGMYGTVVEYGFSGEFSGTTSYEWNPRKDSGDSFDLAAKLGISIEHDASIQVDYSDEMGGEYELGVHAWVVKDDLIEAKEIYGDDRCDTARLAVLRVAAERGKRL